MEEERRLTKTKKKRKRTVISPHEIDILETSFRHQPRPDRFAKIKLAKQMGKSENFISIWFQNRRARERRMSSSVFKGHAEVGTDRSNSTAPSMASASRGCGSIPEASPKSCLQKEMSFVSRMPMFGRMIRMAEAAEGGVLSSSCQQYEEAITDACRGITLLDGRLVYKRGTGYEVLDFKSLN